ncbi:MAG: hypothetical protein HY235_05390 [Acidobacteria bacterium]|nr:hypothetical protein [Acidobacteriota bacterium]
MQPVATAVLLFLVCALGLTAQTPVITEEIVNAAGFERGQPVSPGSVVSIFGSELASGLSQADSVPLSNVLASTSVTFNDVPAPLYFVATAQINAVVPWRLLQQGEQSGTATVVVRRGSASSQPRIVQLAAVAPAIYTISLGGRRYAIAFNAEDGSLAQPDGSFAGIRAQPIPAGKPLAILATGLGPVDPPIEDGRNSSDVTRRTVNTPTVLVGGQEAQVLFSGLTPSYPGVNQINVVVPSGVQGDAVPVQLRLGSITTSDQITIAVR